MSDDQYANWVDVDVEEIWAYMAFMILMGINYLPALEIGFHILVWSRDRFFEITRYFHFVDNTILLSNLVMLSTQFVQNYSLHRENSIDEAIKYEAILTQKTSKTWLQSVGSGRCCDWVCV